MFALRRICNEFGLHGTCLDLHWIYMGLDWACIGLHRIYTGLYVCSCIDLPGFAQCCSGFG